MSSRVSAAGSIVVAFALAGCGGSGQTSVAPDPAGTSTRTVTRAAQVSVAPSPMPNGVPYCAAKALGIHYVGGEGAAGTWVTTFAFVNVTPRPCRLYGYPGVTMLTAAGRRIPIPVERQRTNPPHEVRLNAGDRVNFALGTGDGAVGPCYRAAIFRFIPPNDHAYEQIAYHRMVCGKAEFVSAVGSRY